MARIEREVSILGIGMGVAILLIGCLFNAVVVYPAMGGFSVLISSCILSFIIMLINSEIWTQMKNFWLDTKRIWKETWGNVDKKYQDDDVDED